jgi:protein ImuB
MALAIARDFSPRTARQEDGSVVFDVSGLGRLLGDAHAIGAEIAGAAGLDRPLAGSAGRWAIAVAPTMTAALLLSAAQPGLSVATGDPSAALAILPIATLPSLLPSRVPPEACDRILDVLRRWGLRTLGHVAALPADELSARLGQDGVSLHQIARGLDRAPLVPDADAPRFMQSLELEWPIDALEPLSFVFARLLDPLSESLERADRAAAAIRLDLRLTDRTEHTRTVLLPAAIRDSRVLRTLLLLDLESHPPAAAIDVVTIEIDPAPSRIVQYSLLERAIPSPETLATLTARLGALVGDTRCGSPALLDTHRPDGFEMRRFEPTSAARGSLLAPRSSRLAPRGSLLVESSNSRSREPRPFDNAQGRSESAEERAAGSELAVIRRFRPPVAVRMAVERGCPVYLHIDRRGMPGGRVEQWAGPWRTSGAWWDVDRTCWDRDEWDVALADGTLCRIFRDRVTGQWFMEGILD